MNPKPLSVSRLIVPSASMIPEKLSSIRLNGVVQSEPLRNYSTIKSDNWQSNSYLLTISPHLQDKKPNVINSRNIEQRTDKQTKPQAKQKQAFNPPAN